MSQQIEEAGLIGVGLLGSALAERLLRGGIPVRGYDLDAGRREALERLGGTVARSPTEVFANCEWVILCLPTSGIAGQVLRECVYAPRQRNPAGGSGRLTVIDTTTGAPDEMASWHAKLKSVGVGYLEANVGGSSGQLRDGHARLFLAGDQADVERSEALLSQLAERRFYLGGAGAAARFKLVHNLILGLHRAVLAEGLTFAAALGFEPATTLDILRQTPAASAVMETKGPRMVRHQWEPQAKLSQHLKDVELILAEAERAGAPAPLSEVHRLLLRSAVEKGYGDADNSAVWMAYQPDESGGRQPE